MIKHYIKIAFRNLGRQKWLAVINIAGLSIGLACFILFLLYALNEFSFDRFHQNAKNIFRVYRWTEAMHGDQASANINQPLPLGPAFKQDLPDVENFVRIQEASNESYIKVGDKIDRLKVSFADPQIFSMFSFKLKSGINETALSGLNSIVLTETIAKKYFGSSNPIGQTIHIKKEQSFEPFIVSAIAADIPSNSTIQFLALGNINWLTTTPQGKKGVNNWKRSTYSYHTYIELKPGSQLPGNTQALVTFRKKYYPEEDKELREIGYWKGNGWPATYGLQPLQSIHTDTKIAGGAVPVVSPKTIWILLGIAFAVLLIACINFTTLAIGRSASRAKEIGIRKVVGSGRRSLVWQFLSEALLLSFFSVILGLILTYFLLPYFNQLAGKELRFSFQQFPELTWMIAGLTLIIGILSGSYPALVLSAFKPLEVIKEKIKVGGANLFTRSLVTMQFVLSIGLIASTVIILQQLKYMTGKNPGFQKENIVMVNADDADGKKLYPLFRQAIAGDLSIAGIAAAELGLGEGEELARASLNYDGKPKEVFEYFIDPNYIPLMKMEIIKGRNLDPKISSDTVTSVIINEALARDFGFSIDSAIGQQLRGYSEEVTPVVVGVVKDFNYRPLREKVEPQMFHHFGNYAINKFFVRLKAGDPSKALATLNKAWSSLVTDLPFRYTFLDESLENFYKSETRWSWIIGWAGGISIFLACLGLLGLAALAAVNRTKEIGIRKVLGASLSNIIGLLSKDFLKLVIIAIIIASPLAWYFMSKWLQDFAYRINISWVVFLIAGLSAVTLALVTVSFQAIKAAIANPVKSLRTE